MTVREEYEKLKLELLARLTDATPMCNLEFPFEFELPKDEENLYFTRGLNTRLVLKRSMIVLDNTYRKVRLFPSEDIIETYVEVQDGILTDLKKNLLEAYLKDSWKFQKENLEEFDKYLDTLVERIKKASEKYVELLKKLTPEDIEKELIAQEKLKKSQTPLQENKESGKKGLF